MHLSFLSEGSLSDRFDDAGIIDLPPVSQAAAIHFPALCRGLVVIAALTLPIGLTIVAQGSATGSPADPAHLSSPAPAPQLLPER